MKIDFSTALTGFNGENLVEADGRKITLAMVCSTVLGSTLPDETPTGEEKLKRFALGMKVCKGGSYDITAEDRVLLKQLIGKTFSPLVVGSALSVLDPSDNTE